MPKTQAPKNRVSTRTSNSRKRARVFFFPPSLYLGETGNGKDLGEGEEGRMSGGLDYETGERRPF